MVDNNIGNIGPIIPQNLNDLSTGKNAPKIESDEGIEGGVVRDRIEISNEAQVINKAIQNINAMVEIRVDLVEKAIQERVLENQRIPAYQIAARLLLEDSVE